MRKLIISAHPDYTLGKAARVLVSFDGQVWDTFDRNQANAVDIPTRETQIWLKLGRMGRTHEVKVPAGDESFELNLRSLVNQFEAWPEHFRNRYPSISSDVFPRFDSKDDPS